MEWVTSLMGIVGVGGAIVVRAARLYKMETSYAVGMGESPVKANHRKGEFWENQAHGEGR